MNKPILLDLFCGAGGAAMGYHRAGFEIIGVDIKPQLRYPFEFVRADAMTFPLDGFDVIHASPPCQGYSIANYIWGKTDHPLLIEPIRERFLAADKPYVIENVPGAPLKAPLTLCGLAFGLNVKRHRIFETSPQILLAPPCPPGHRRLDYVLVFGGGVRKRVPQQGRTLKGGPKMNRPTLPLSVGRAAMEIDWMSRFELSEAVPPAYTEYIGRQLMALLGEGVEAWPHPTDRPRPKGAVRAYLAWLGGQG